MLCQCIYHFLKEVSEISETGTLRLTLINFLYFRYKLMILINTRPHVLLKPIGGGARLKFSCLFE